MGRESPSRRSREPEFDARAPHRLRSAARRCRRSPPRARRRRPPRSRPAAACGRRRTGRSAPDAPGMRRRPASTIHATTCASGGPIGGDVRGPAGAQILAKRVVGTADVAACDQRGREMRSGRQPGLCLHGREQLIARQPQLGSMRRRFCACAAGAGRLAQSSIRCEPQPRPGSIHSPRTWIAWERQEAEISTPGTSRHAAASGRCVRLLESGDRVVIGERQHIDAGCGGALRPVRPGSSDPSEQSEWVCRSKHSRHGAAREPDRLQAPPRQHDEALCPLEPIAACSRRCRCAAAGAGRASRG